MGVNRYIGARYVPKFMGTWQLTVTYEPLSIVTHNGISYTSKKVVPANTPLPNGTDTEYWAITGITDAQILQIINRLDTLDQEYNDLESAVSGINAQLVALSSNLSTLSGKVDLLTKRKVITISDSYGRAEVTGGTPWFNSCEGHVRSDVFRFQHFVQGGAAFGWPLNNNLQFINVFNNAVIPNISFNPAEVTDIVLLGGANDGNLLDIGDTTISDIQNNMITGLNALHTACPNALIHVAFAGNKYEPPGNTSNTLRPSYIKARFAWHQGASACDYGVVVENAVYILRNNELIGDANIHPNAAGSYQLGVKMAEYLKSGSMDVHYYNDELSFQTFDDNTTIESGTKLFESLNNALVSFGISDANNRLRLTFNTPISLSRGDNPLPIIKLPKYLVRGYAYRQTAVSCNVLIGLTENDPVSNSTYIVFPAMIMALNGYLYIVIETNRAINNIGAIIVQSCVLTIDSDFA